MTDTATDSTGRKPAGALFVVATPIGNLQDLSPRAAACLRDADLLLAEDTRHTRTLLEACGIARPAGSIESLHEHNERERVPALLSRLGEHRRSQACLYVNRLADVDLAVLEEIVRRSFDVGAAAC